MFNASTPYMKQLAGHCKMYFVYDYDHFIKPILEKPVPAGQNRLFVPRLCIQNGLWASK